MGNLGRAHIDHENPKESRVEHDLMPVIIIKTRRNMSLLKANLIFP